MEKRKFSPTEFHTESYKRQHCYSYQNDLLFQHNFPLYYYDGDFVSGFYEDRTWSWSNHWTEALNRLSSSDRKRIEPHLKSGTMIGWNKMSIKDLLKLLQAQYPDKNIVGFRLIRNINVSNGYPCDYLECFGKGENTPQMEFGQNLAFNDCPEYKGKSVNKLFNVYDEYYGEGVWD